MSVNEYQNYRIITLTTKLVRDWFSASLLKPRCEIFFLLFLSFSDVVSYLKNKYSTKKKANTSDMLRQRICPSLENMQELHTKYGWVPGPASIRPNPEIIEKKHNYISNMLTRYRTLQDFFLHRIFGLKSHNQGDWNNSRMCVSDEEILKAKTGAMEKSNHHEYRFIPNLFSYQVPTDTNHYVIWFLLNGNETIDPVTHSPVTENEINSCIEEALRKHLGPSNETFQFVWYLNPKPTVVSEILYHVQVFWIP